VRVCVCESVCVRESLCERLCHFFVNWRSTSRQIYVYMCFCVRESLCMRVFCCVSVVIYVWVCERLCVSVYVSV